MVTQLVISRVDEEWTRYKQYIALDEVQEWMNIIGNARYKMHENTNDFPINFPIITRNSFSINIHCLIYINCVNIRGNNLRVAELLSATNTRNAEGALTKNLSFEDPGIVYAGREGKSHAIYRWQQRPSIS